MLQSIVIENFQSLRDPVEVPLAPITLLYGPNSAGKSAVLDALLFARDVFMADEGRVRTAILRHQHQPAPGLKANPIKLRFQSRAKLNPIEIEGPAALAVHRLPPELNAQLFWESAGSVTSEDHGEVQIEWVVEAQPDPFLFPLRRVSIDINGHPTLTLSWADDEGLEVWLSIEPTAFGSLLLDVADQCGASLESSGSYMTRVAVDYQPLRVVPTEPNQDDASWFPQVLIALANWLFGRATELLAPPFVVSADRGVIPDRDLVVLARSAGPDGRKSGLPADFTSVPDRDLLAASLIGGSRSPVIQRLCIAHLGWTEQDWPRPPGCTSAESADVFVNRCLSDHLFLDAGYQLRFDVCDVLPAAGSRQAGLPPEGRKRGAVVLCSLTDRHGRQLTFQDVGTGISCALPVLTALHGGFSFVQQPELHLHPALQAALGDVMVETANRGPVLHLLETHSEYILLRCLKRLRQTAIGQHPENSPLRLTPAQLAVLYFDPRPDGTTRVRRIRVTDDGEFIDRWPRGFFEERGRELFDE